MAGNDHRPFFMPNFVYPSSQLDNRAILLSLVGSHWQSVYQGNKLVEDYLFARGQIEQQIFDDLLEAADCVGRLTTPVYHVRHWRPLTLLASQRNSQVLQYGDGAVYGRQPDTGVLYQYGLPADLPVHAFPLPAEIKFVPAIFNRIESPSASLIYGVDFIIDDGSLIFRENPFTDDRWPQQPVYGDIDITDQALQVWLYQGREDKDYVHTHHGYVVGIQGTDQPAKDLVNAISDGLVTGSTMESVQAALSAWLQVPLTKAAQETVELIQADARQLVIVTDTGCYTFPLGSTPVVSVGDVLPAGSALVDTLRLYEFNRGDVPTGLLGLSVGSGLISGSYADDLAFLNQEVALVVDTSGEFTKVSFQLGGFAGDMIAFWDEVHARGVDAGQTLAQLLDVRGSAAASQPGPASLPATINPLQFLCQNVLRNNAALVWIKMARLPAGVDTTRTTWLRKLVPPWNTLILLYEFEVDDEPITLEGPGGETDLGLTESPTLLLGATPIVEALSLATMFSESPVLRPLAGSCH